jgi:tetratricopeptide (TPR) repeat protein
MNIFIKIPVNFDISLAFIVLITTVLTIYMVIRAIKRTTFLTLLALIIQLCMLTTGILTVFYNVLAIPLYEIILILFGVIAPFIFFFYDYINMKKRLSTENINVPLIEKKETQSYIEWKYEEYINELDEWQDVINTSDVVSTLNLTDKSLKNNINKQLYSVQKMIDKMDYKKALEAYIIISEIVSNNALIYYNTAWLCYKNGQFENSAKYYKKALSLINQDNKDYTSYIHFGYGLCLYKSGKYELAISHFKLACQEGKKIRESDLNIARSYIAIGDTDAAQKYIKSALEMNGDNKLRYLLARLCYENNKKMECRYQLEIIAENDQNFKEAFILLGKLNIDDEDWENAERVYKRLIHLMPRDADSYYYLGVAQREMGKTDEALSNFKFASEIMPAHSKALYSMASIYDAKGKTDKAIECLNKSLDGNEKLEMAYNLLAEIYISYDRILDAIHVYEIAVREHPESYLMNYNLGVSLMMMKRFEEAVKAFKRAHKIVYDDPSLYYNWASAEIALKNYYDAARLYKDGLKYKPDDDEILFGLARVSALSGDAEATLGFLKQAIDVNPSLKLRAKASHVFAAYRTNPEFMELTRLPEKVEQKTN